MTKLLVLVVGAALAAAGPAEGADDDAAKRASATAVREAGVAMWRWLADQLPTGEPTAEQAREMAMPDWDTCSISPDEVASLVVPKYINALPRTDGWAHELQFCLKFDRAQPEVPRAALGVRSPGRDGKFSDAEYEPGPSADPDQDVVWRNGMFIRWPEKGHP